MLINSSYRASALFGSRLCPCLIKLLWKVCVVSVIRCWCWLSSILMLKHFSWERCMCSLIECFLRSATLNQPVDHLPSEFFLSGSRLCPDPIHMAFISVFTCYLVICFSGLLFIYPIMPLHFISVQLLLFCLMSLVKLYPGICCLSCPCETWWSQEACFQGYCVWEAHKPGSYPTKVPAQQEVCCWGACWSQVGRP